MRQLVNEDDFNALNGRFIVQLQFDKDENFDFSKTDNPGFWLEKRISFVNYLDSRWVSAKLTELYPEDKGFVSLSGFFYNHSPMRMSEFVHHFNGTAPEGKEQPKRFCRLLTQKELDWLNERMKSRQHG